MNSTPTPPPPPWPTTPPIPRGKIDPFPGFPTGSGGSYITDGHLYISNPAAPRPGLIRIAGSAGIRSAGNPETFPLRLMRRNYAILAALAPLLSERRKIPARWKLERIDHAHALLILLLLLLFFSPFPSFPFLLLLFCFECNGLKLTVSHLSGWIFVLRKKDIDAI